MGLDGNISFGEAKGVYLSLQEKISKSGLTEAGFIGSLGDDALKSLKVIVGLLKEHPELLYGMNADQAKNAKFELPNINPDKALSAQHTIVLSLKKDASQSDSIMPKHLDATADLIDKLLRSKNIAPSKIGKAIEQKPTPTSIKPPPSGGRPPSPASPSLPPLPAMPQMTGGLPPTPKAPPPPPSIAKYNTPVGPQVTSKQIYDQIYGMPDFYKSQQAQGGLITGKYVSAQVVQQYADYTRQGAGEGFAMFEAMNQLQNHYENVAKLDPAANGIPHRYKNEIPSKTNVTLQVQGETKRLNANRISVTQSRAFTASHCPGPQDEALVWQFLVNEKTACIDLTNAADHNRATQKADVYYPQAGETRRAGDLTITLGKQEKLASGATLYSYNVRNKNGQVSQVRRYGFENWNDEKSITPQALDQLVKDTTSNDQNIMVHCRAGLGRTCSLIAAYTIKERIQNGSINEANLNTSIMDLIVDLRKDRGFAAVQTAPQFQMLIDYGKYLIAQSKTGSF